MFEFLIFVAENTDFDENSATPGVAGFVATAVFALLVIAIGFDLVRRVRRTQYRAEIREKLAAEREQAAPPVE